MPFVRIIELSRCRVGLGTFVECGEQELAVFWLNGDTEVFVIDNACPHTSGNLSAGSVADCVVTCPWHDWEFDLKSGRCVDSPQAVVTRYPVELRDGVVFADLQSPVRPGLWPEEC
jgi:nitrite reductase/ring-hydroxylating ferredoxin subunit